MNSKPAHIVIVVVGCIAVVLSLVWSFGGRGVQLTHRVNLVDVKTGQIYQASTAKRAIMEPAPAPDGEPRLIRVRLDEAGKWYIPGRVLRVLKELPFDPNVVDEESGEILTPSKDVQNYEVK